MSVPALSESAGGLDFSNQVLKAFLGYARKDALRYGLLLEALKADPQWIQDGKQWHSAEFHERFLSAFCELFGPESVIKATEAMYSRKGFTLGESALGLLISPDILLSRLGRMVRRMNVYNSYSFHKGHTQLNHTAGRLIQKYRDPDRGTLNAYLCDSCRASLTGAFEKLGYRLLSLNEKSCVKRGDSQCEYEMVWSNKGSLFAGLTLLLPLMIWYLIRWPNLGFLGSEASVFLLFLLSAAVPAVYLISQWKTRRRLDEAFEFQQETLDQLRELLLREHQLNHSILEYQAQYQRMVNMAMLGELSYGIVHDMASPITVIQMGSGSLLEKMHNKAEIPPQEVAKVFDAIKRSTDRLVRMQNLLRRTVKSENQIEKKRVDINRMMTDVVSLFDTLTRHRAIEVETHLDLQDVAALVTSENHLERCLANAIQNAINAMKTAEIRKLRISAVKSGNHMEFAVSDSGAGIEEDVRGQLFSHLAPSRNATGEIAGSGFGLIAMKKMIEEINGTIEISSAAGMGTTVRFLVPIEPPKSLPEAA